MDSERYCEALCAGFMIEPPANCLLPPCACTWPVPPEKPLPPPPAPSDACFAPPDPGPCHAYAERYWFDPNTGGCNLFIYGGCKGNENNFETPEACFAACVGGGVMMDACALGVALDTIGKCPGTLAAGLCFRSPSDACACLGCPDEKCAVTVAPPGEAFCL